MRLERRQDIGYAADFDQRDIVALGFDGTTKRVEVLENLIENLILRRPFYRVVESPASEFLIVGIACFDQSVAVHQYLVVVRDGRVLQ
jgi:hypothetical protein